MFFDQPTVDTEYLDLLVQIAKSQRELFLADFHIQNRFPREEKKGFLGFGKKKNPNRDALLRRVEELKEKANEHRRKKGYPNGITWWSIPFEQLEHYLFYDLARKQPGGGWRFEFEYLEVPKGDSTVLMLRDEGHCSSFSATTSYEYEEISQYTVDERKAMVDRKNNSMIAFDLAWAATSRGPVRSVLSNEDYDSAADYLLSGEHLALHYLALDNYAESLYTRHETQKVTAYSNSTHYECIYCLGAFRKENGVLTHLEIRQYDRMASRGTSIRDEDYEERDASVEMAYYLAENPVVTDVPLKLFGGDLTNQNYAYEDAMRLAEIYTCLAEKISF